MTRFHIRLFSFFLIAAFMCWSCAHEISAPDPGIETIDYDGITNIVYSQHVQPIFNQKCMASSCHNSVDRASGLELGSWETLIRGSQHGEVIISGSAEHSHMVEHISGKASPRMPLGRDPLPEKVIGFISRWIGEGAKNDAGQRPYENIVQKAYITNQGDDLVSVISTEHNLTIRLIPVGDSPTLDVPHNIWVDDQAQFWYVSLIATGEVWKFDVATDTFQGKVRAGISPANIVATPDGTKILATDWDVFNDGRAVRVIDATNMQVIRQLTVGLAPHGINFSHDGQYVYVTNYLSDSISILRASDYEEVQRVLLAPNVNPVRSSLYQPLQVVLTPDDKYAYVSCYNSNEVRVLDTARQEVVAAIPVGRRPFLLEVTPNGEYVYVANQISSDVTVIRVADNQVVNTIEHDSFANPHGVAFTPDGRFAYVTNENLDGSFPQHHPTEGGGNIGNVQVIDTQSFAVVKTIEVEVDPTGIVILPK
ncbi:MAG: beta-propeller fold lactonase family protein [bacterium]